MSPRVVLDASAALEATLRRKHSLQILDLLERSSWVGVPDLFAAEVANALWKHHRAGDLEPDEAHSALDDCLRLVDESVPSDELAPEALATAVAHDHPVYDALYATLARRRGATVVTLDRRLVKLLEVMVVPWTCPWNDG